MQRRVDIARVYMPTDLDPPVVTKAGQAEPPLLDVAVSSTTLSQPQIADLINSEITPLIEQIPNVQSVDVYGSATREFHVEPDPGRLDGTNATLEDIFNAVAINNLNVPGGIMTQPTREGSVAIHDYVEKADDLLGIPFSPISVLQYPVKSLKIGDVANAYDSHIAMRTISSYNGHPRVYMEINPTLDADQIKATAALRAELKKIQAQFPQLHFHEIDAPADYTQKMLVGVGQSLIEGIILTAIVMLLFLHAWRNAVVVFLAIPTSILATFIVMRLFGFHIDSMSMMGLALIIGILVDDSIVVLENITRHRDMGLDPMTAAITGRTEIGGAAVAITMVDVVVFLPIAFMSGIVGAYLREYGAVVVTATLFSLFVSFTLTPLLAAKWSVLSRSEAPPAWLRLLDDRRVDIGLLLLAAAMFADRNVTGWFLLNAHRDLRCGAAVAQRLRPPVRVDTATLSLEVLTVRAAARCLRGLRLRRAPAQFDHAGRRRRHGYGGCRRRLVGRLRARPRRRDAACAGRVPRAGPNASDRCASFVRSARRNPRRWRRSRFRSCWRC